ncbi:MAG: hypothetical protein HON90_02145 [Halobacteriovoraceae bacterium]|jgi:hypothetical protein|nr:hypothetical protein [Halobacteriovoraceae bacterium]
MKKQCTALVFLALISSFSTFASNPCLNISEEYVGQNDTMIEAFRCNEVVEGSFKPHISYVTNGDVYGADICISKWKIEGNDYIVINGKIDAGGNLFGSKAITSRGNISAINPIIAETDQYFRIHEDYTFENQDKIKFQDGYSQDGLAVIATFTKTDEKLSITKSDVDASLSQAGVEFSATLNCQKN